MQKSIDRLRQNIKEIDAEIFGLIKKRLEIATVIGDLKSHDGRPLRDLRQESLVFSQHIGLANEFEIPVGNEIKKITQALLDLSLKVQIENTIPV